MGIFFISDLKIWKELAFPTSTRKEIHITDPKNSKEFCPLKTLLILGTNRSDLKWRLYLRLFLTRNPLRLPPDKSILALYVSIANGWIFYWWFVKDFYIRLVDLQIKYTFFLSRASKTLVSLNILIFWRF